MDEGSATSRLAKFSIGDELEDDAPLPAAFDLGPDQNVWEGDGEAPTPEPFPLLPERSKPQNPYLPLLSDRRETRIVKIIPGRFADPISCHLLPVSLYDDPFYEALSYTWGDPNVTKPVILNGITVNVTGNLETCLRHLRKEDRAQIMWIDAICINQADITERNSQVQLMRYIYEQAMEVVIYLGDGTNDTYQAMDIIRTFIQDRHFTENPLFDCDPVDPETSKLIKTKVNVLEVLQPLQQITSLPWWTRMWVVQEVVLARKTRLVCGNCSMPWEELRSASQTIANHNDTCCALYKFLRQDAQGPVDDQAGIILQRFQRLVMEFEDHRKRHAVGYMPDLGQLISCLSEKGTTDPRDKVYAALGFHEKYRTIIQPDYHKSVNEVYKHTAREIIFSWRNLDLFVTTSYSKRSPGIPSWVPDWTHKRNPGQMLHSNRIWNYHASGASKTDARCANLAHLLLDGFGIDTIREVGHIMEFDMGHPEASLAVFKNWEALIQVDTRERVPFVGGGDRFWAYFTILTSDQEAFLADIKTMSPSKAKMYEGMSENLLRIFRIQRTIVGDPPPAFSITILPNNHDYWWDAVGMLSIHFYSAIQGRRLFITEKGWIGLGPPETQVGDGVFVLAGGKTPYILRNTSSVIHRTPEGVAHMLCELIGEAYVYGAMQGEFWKFVEDGQVKPFKITLS